MSLSPNELRIMKEQLLAFLDSLKSNRSINSLDEAGTKQTIILPLLSKLGWNTVDIDEVRPEHKINDGRVDYRLSYIDTEVFVEVKRASEHLDNHEYQLFDYSSHENPELAVLTNGIDWWFYDPLKKGDWNARKFDSINIYNQKTIEVVQKFIDYLAKNKIGSPEIEENINPSADKEDTQPPNVIKEKESMTIQPTPSESPKPRASLRIMISLFIVMILLTPILYVFLKNRNVESPQILSMPQYPQMPVNPQLVQNIPAFDILPSDVDSVIIYPGSPEYTTFTLSPNSSTQPSTEYEIQVTSSDTGNIRTVLTAAWSQQDIQSKKQLLIAVKSTADEINNYPLITAYWNGVTNSVQSNNFSNIYTYSLFSINGETEQQLVAQQNQQLTQQYQQQLAQYQTQYATVSAQQQSVKEQQILINNQYQQKLKDRNIYANRILYIFIPIDILLLVVILLIIFNGKITGKDDAISIKKQYQKELNAQYDTLVDYFNNNLQEPDKKISDELNNAVKLQNDIKVRENEKTNLIKELYNALNNETDFEKWMLTKTQEGLNSRQPPSINQNVRRFNVDEMYVNMGDYLKQYPVYASRPRFETQYQTIKNAIMEIGKKKEEYNKAVKDYNSDLARFPNLLEAQYDIDKYTRILDEGMKKQQETKYFNSMQFKLLSIQSKQNIMIDSRQHDIEKQKIKLNAFREKYGSYKNKVLNEMPYEN